MIIRYAPIDNPWHRAAAGWFLAFFLAGCLAFPAFDEFGYEVDELSLLIWIGVLGSLLFYIAGKVEPKTPVRVLRFIAVVGLFAVLPMILVTSFGGMAFFVLTTKVSVWVLLVRTAYVVCVLAWPAYALRRLRIRLSKTRFIEKEFRLAEAGIMLSRSPKTKIEETYISGNSMVRRAIHRAAPFVGLFLLMGYPIQRLLTDAGGVPAAMLFLSIFLIPWSVYAIGQFVCGTYLWFYCVLKLERQCGKPVLFEN